MFKISQVKHNSLDYHLHVQNTQILRMDNPCFFQMSFFSTYCAPFLLKIEKNLNIDYKGKRTSTDENCFKTHLNTCGSKVLLTLKNMDFENVHLTKVNHIYVIEVMNA